MTVSVPREFYQPETLVPLQGCRPSPGLTGGICLFILFYDHNDLREALATIFYNFYVFFKNAFKTNSL